MRGTAELGLALLMPGLGSLVAMPVTGRLCNRFGSRAVVAVTAVAGVRDACPPGVSSVDRYGRRGPVRLGHVLRVVGRLDERPRQRVERAAGPDWMPRYHAGWSVGGIAGAALGVLAAKAGREPRRPLRGGVGSARGSRVVVALRSFVDDAHLVDERHVR